MRPPRLLADVGQERHGVGQACLAVADSSCGQAYFGRVVRDPGGLFLRTRLGVDLCGAGVVVAPVESGSFLEEGLDLEEGIAECGGDRETFVEVAEGVADALQAVARARATEEGAG